jgi:hypothetical protein
VSVSLALLLSLVQLPVLPEGSTGIAVAYPGDKGIERSPSVLFHDDFESGKPTGWDMVFQEGSTRVISDEQRSKVLEMMVPKDNAEHSNSAVKGFAGQEVVFLRFYSKFDPEFNQVGSSHNGGYLAALSPGLPYATPGVKADGKNKFVASFECWRGEPETPSPGWLNVYCYHPEQRSQWGDHFYPNGEVMPNTSIPGNFGPAFVSRKNMTPVLGKWACYEFMMKANTPGSRDGRIACWVDGKLVADFPNLRLRDDADLKINHAAIDLHIGSNLIRTNYKWYDDVVIATSYIGPKH